MVNLSKINDKRFWEKWKASGAVGTIEDAVLKTMQINRKQRSICVDVNESAGFYGDTVFDNESRTYKINTNGRRRFYSYGKKGESLFGADIPYAFQIESVLGVGQVVFRQGGISTEYHSQKGPCPKDSDFASVAGVLVSKAQETDEVGDKLVSVALFDKIKDRGLVEKTKAFLREKGVSKYIAFQS